eukprot:6717307-Pyramimonas_sp.AAC.1
MIAYGLAAFQRGGRDDVNMPDSCLGCASFPKTSEADMGNYMPPKDYKLETRPWPRHASTPQH